MDFIKIWQPLYNHGSSERRKAECQQLWESLSEAQQQHVHTIITSRLAAGIYVQYDPYRAIVEYIPRQKQAASPSGTPTNYNGRALPTDQPVVSARYDNRWGTYTVQEARTFRMTIRIPESIFLHGKALYDAQNHGEHLVQVARPESNERYVYDEAKPDPRRIYMCTKADADLYQLRIITDPRQPIRLEI